MSEAERCPINFAVIRAIKQLLAPKEFSELNLQGKLLERNVPLARAKTLAHTIFEWEKPKPFRKKEWTTPDSIILLELAKIFAVSLDWMVGHTPPANQALGHPDRADSDPKSWLSKFLAQCRNLSCYFVFLELDTIQRWRKEAQTIDAEGDRLSLAERWTKEIYIFDASLRLRQDHDYRLSGSLSDKTMHDLISARLHWIDGVPGRGPDLKQRAQSEILTGIFDTIRNSKDSGSQSRYPTRRGQEIKSLRVRYDSVPHNQKEIGWVVYYNWGPKMTSEDIDRLFQL